MNGISLDAIDKRLLMNRDQDDGVHGPLLPSQRWCVLVAQILPNLPPGRLPVAIPWPRVMPSMKTA